ncbi:MAG: DUF4911 domain-containing protein [Phascolarctobacterium sp.]|nr:DUF4911 domain-containing protein [Phascolarctobacterium sp.]
MNNIIRVRVDSKNIAYVNWIMQGFGHLTAINTIDGDRGIMLFYPTPDTSKLVLDILKNLPFEVEIIETFSSK